MAQFEPVVAEGRIHFFIPCGGTTGRAGRHRQRLAEDRYLVAQHFQRLNR
jgi:hypothetical protein